MLPIDYRLMSEIVRVLSSVHEGLLQGYLTVNLPDEELAKQAHQHLDESLSKISASIEAELLSHLLDSSTQGAEEAPMPTVDNVVIFPNVTPEA